jgi:5'(3')-deoxyribonucleotidase
MPRRRVIAIDCDDVLVETSPYLIADYNQRFGTNLGLEDMYSGDLEVWQTSSDEEAIDRVEAYVKTEEYQQLRPSRKR